MASISEDNCNQNNSSNYSIIINDLLDKLFLEFFSSKDGKWFNCCFSKCEDLRELYLPCHLRNNEWLAAFFIEKFKLFSIDIIIFLDYLQTSSLFNSLRKEYEQKIVRWQIERMISGRDDWYLNESQTCRFFINSVNADVAFRDSVYNQLVSIGIDKDAVIEGIEKNYNLWRKQYMRVSFYNLYCVKKNDLFDVKYSEMSKELEEHFEKWYILRLYNYYVEYKDDVDRYGEVLPEMLIRDEEVSELNEWLLIAHEKRMLEKENNHLLSENSFDTKNSDFYFNNERSVLVEQSNNDILLQKILKN